MSTGTTVTPLASYRNATPYPFCPGCGHGQILDRLNAALVGLQLDPRRVVLVSDIGCSGLSDQYFATSAFHGLHGRSLTCATGIKLAQPELTVIVIMGDGGTGIGGAHLLAAARRNIGLTVLVCNNFNFGMTGGQHSGTTPPGALTTTTPAGNLERPLDVCATVAANGASWVWRGTSFDADLHERIAEAVTCGGFALLDIWELCTAYFVPENRATRATLAETMQRLGLPAGVLARRPRPEFAAALRAAGAAARALPAATPRPIEARFPAALDRRASLVLAGSAGGKVRSAARLVAQAAMSCGLWVAQRDDYPVTVKTGHSVAELVLSPREVRWAGVLRPDALVAVSAEGLARVKPLLAAQQPGDTLFTLPTLPGAATRATLRVLDPGNSGPPPGSGRLALWAVARALHELGWLPPQALLDAAQRDDAHAADQVRTLRAALAAGA